MPQAINTIEKLLLPLMKRTIILLKLEKNLVQIPHALVIDIALNFLAKDKYYQFTLDQLMNMKVFELIFGLSKRNSSEYVKLLCH